MKKQWILLPIAAVSTVAPLSVTSCSDTQAFEQLTNSYVEMLKETISLKDYEGKTPQQIKQELKTKTYIDKFSQPCETYFFDNINYDDEDRAIWPAHQHIVRTLQIAMIADRDNNNELFDIATKLTCYWLCNDYVNSNWWFNEIGVPRDLSNLAFFIKDKLTKEQQDKLIEWIHHGSLKYNEATQRYTGTNTFWACDITMKSACLTHDEDEMNIMLDYLYNEIKLDANEGFQSDGTYFQHDHLLYTGGYGRQGAIMLAKIASAFANTRKYVLDDKKLKIVVDFVLDGMRYMTHKGNFTWQCMGRTFTRKQASEYAGGVTDLGNIVDMKYLANLPNCPRREELNDLISKWEKKESTFSGIKFFPKSKFIACNFDGVYVGLKGTDGNMVNCEMGNGENMLGHNLSYGFTTAVMDTGKEYDDISPVWVYDYIPGTTTPEETDSDLLFYDNDMDTSAKKGGTFYSGYNDEHNVAMVSQTSYQRYRSSPTQYTGSVNYTITAFACDDGAVILGTNIYSTGEIGLLHTTLDQFDIQSDNYGLSDDEKTFMHDNVVYKNIEVGADQKIGISGGGEVVQPWWRNNSSYGDETITKRPIIVYLSNPDKSHYAYSIQSKNQQDKQFKVACNTTVAQAVELPNGKIAAIFYTNGDFEYGSTKYEGNKGEFKIFPKT